MYSQRPSYRVQQELGAARRIQYSKRPTVAPVKKQKKKSAAKDKGSLPHKFKTQMCEKFSKGLDCPFGGDCNFAHGQKELDFYLKRSEQFEVAKKLEQVTDLHMEDTLKRKTSLDVVSQVNSDKPLWTQQLMKAMNEGRNSNRIEEERETAASSDSISKDSGHESDSFSILLQSDEDRSSSGEESENFTAKGEEFDAKVGRSFEKTDGKLKKGSSNIINVIKAQSAHDTCRQPIKVYTAMMEQLESKVQLDVRHEYSPTGSIARLPAVNDPVRKLNHELLESICKRGLSSLTSSETELEEVRRLDCFSKICEVEEESDCDEVQEEEITFKTKPVVTVEPPCDDSYQYFSRNLKQAAAAQSAHLQVQNTFGRQQTMRISPRQEPYNQFWSVTHQPNSMRADVVPFRPTVACI